jgi:hypothetical protein
MRRRRLPGHCYVADGFEMFGKFSAIFFRLAFETTIKALIASSYPPLWKRNDVDASLKLWRFVS